MQTQTPQPRSQPSGPDGPLERWPSQDGDLRLDPDVVWTSDGGGRATAARKPVRGGARVARAWAALSRRSVREPIEIKLNGRLGLMLHSGGGQRAALSFVVSDGRITRVDAIRNPEKLRRV